MNISDIITLLIGFALAILCAIFLVRGFINFGKAFWSLFNHSIIPKNAILLQDAKVVDVQSEKVQYTKNGTKFKTTVYFSDGFRFVTHETERDDGLLSYQISISPALYKWMIEEATERHDCALAKQQKKFNFKRKG